MNLLWIQIAIFLCKSVYGAKILLVPCQMTSHVLEQTSLGEELVSRGHEVFVVLSSRFPNAEKFHRVGIQTLQFYMSDVLATFTEEFERTEAKHVFEDPGTLAEFFAFIVNRDCQLMMDDIAFIEHIKEIKFDLAIADGFILSQCSLLLPANLRIPFISMSATLSSWMMRSPALPSFFPIPSLWLLSGKMSFTDRLWNLVSYIIVHNFDKIVPPSRNMTLLRKYLPNMSSWDELFLKSELFFWEWDHHLDYVFPVLPNTILVPGLTISSVKPLPEELRKILDNSEHGVILITFGSTANYLPKRIVEEFFKAFKTLKQTVLAKFKVPEDVTVPANVVILSWLPQNDLLAHNNTKLFITHCGNNGQYEALHHGVPMIGFPLFAEQAHNCQRAALKRFGVEMNIHQFTSEQLVRNIELVIGDGSYLAEIHKASEIWRSDPMTPRQRAAYWVEHVLQFGSQHLRSYAVDMPFYQFMMLDILAFLICILIFVALTLKCIIGFIIRKARKSVHRKTE